MDQNMMRGENEELNAAALEETSAQELTAADSAAQEEASQQPQDGEAVPPPPKLSRSRTPKRPRWTAPKHPSSRKRISS